MFLAITVIVQQLTVTVRDAGAALARHADYVADIFQVIVVTRIQYAAPASSGLSSAIDRARLDSLMLCGKRLGYCSNDVPTVTELFKLSRR